MNDLEIIIRAFQMEAQQKPTEKIFFGKIGYTFEEFAKMLNGLKHLPRSEKKLVQSHLDRSLKMFHENENYRKHMMTLAGVPC